MSPLTTTKRLMKRHFQVNRRPWSPGQDRSPVLDHRAWSATFNVHRPQPHRPVSHFLVHARVLPMLSTPTEILCSRATFLENNPMWPKILKVLLASSRPCSASADSVARHLLMVLHR